MAKRYKVTAYFDKGVPCSPSWAFWVEVPNPAWRASYAGVYSRRHIPATVCVRRSRVNEVEPVYTGGGGGWGLYDVGPLEGVEVDADDGVP